MKKGVTITVLLAFLSVWHAPPASGEPGANRKAMLLSLIIPGWGQYYSGSPGYARIFFASELAIWGTYYYNTMMKDAKRQDYLAWAALHAGVNPVGHGSSFLNAIGSFNSAFEYRAYQLTRENPALYPASMDWNWDESQGRQRFKQLRENELDYENNLKYCVAGIALNHLLAALHASKQSSGDKSASGVTVRMTVRGLAAVYSRSY